MTIGFTSETLHNLHFFSKRHPKSFGWSLLEKFTGCSILRKIWNTFFWI
jgi:hypothetical protein